MNFIDEVKNCVNRLKIHLSSIIFKLIKPIIKTSNSDVIESGDIFYSRFDLPSADLDHAMTMWSDAAQIVECAVTKNSLE